MHSNLLATDKKTYAELQFHRRENAVNGMGNHQNVIHAENSLCRSTSREAFTRSHVLLICVQSSKVMLGHSFLTFHYKAYSIMQSSCDRFKNVPTARK
jgi:hypothetical protein